MDVRLSCRPPFRGVDFSRGANLLANRTEFEFVLRGANSCGLKSTLQAHVWAADSSSFAPCLKPGSPFGTHWMSRGPACC